MAATVDAALEWLAARDASRPFFLFLHTKSVHATPSDPEWPPLSDAPYDKPEPYRTRFVPGRELRFEWREGSALGVTYLRTLNEAIGRGAFDAGQRLVGDGQP